MKWIERSRSFAQSLAVSLATSTLVFAPVAQGAAAANAHGKAVKAPAKWIQSPLPKTPMNYNVDKNTFQELMAITGAGKNKNITVGEFYQRLRPYLPATLADDLGVWAMLNRNEKMPQFEASTYKDSDGKEQLRVILTKGSESVTVSFDPNSEKKFLKVNNVDLSKKDVLFHEQAFRKIAKFDKNIRASILAKPPIDIRKTSIALSFEEFARLNATQQAIYLAHIRYVSMAAQKVMELYHPGVATNAPEDVYKFFARVLVGDEADASAASYPKFGDTCIVNGYVSIYGKTERRTAKDKAGGPKEILSCGGGPTGRANLQEQIKTFANGKNTSCPPHQLPCNEYMFSYKSNGDRFCVEDKPESILHATSQACADQSPLHPGTPSELSEKKAIVENYLKYHDGIKIDLKFNKDGKISPEQFKLISDYLKKQNDYVQMAFNTCLEEPLSGIIKTKEDQATACNAILTRKIQIQAWDVETPVPVATHIEPPALPPLDNLCGYPDPEGSKPGPDGKCTCPAELSHPTTRPDANGKELVVCEAGPVATNPPQKKQCSENPKMKDDGKGGCEPICSWFCGGIDWKLPAIGLGILGLFWILNKKHPDPKTPVKFDPCPPAPYACTPTNPVVPKPPVLIPPLITTVPVPPTTPPATPVTPPPTTPTTPTTPVIPDPVPDVIPESGGAIPTTTSGGVR